MSNPSHVLPGDSIGGRCSYGTMDWYCALRAGHDGPHESESLPVDSAQPARVLPESEGPLPCPFCGKEPTALTSRNVIDEDDFQIECRNLDCGVQPDCFMLGYSRDETIALWNRRASSVPAPDVTQDTKGLRSVTSAEAPESQAWPAREQIGETISFAREAKGLTQAELAALAGTTQARVCEIETSQCDARIGTIERIASHLGLVLRLVTVAAPESEPTPTDDRCLATRNGLRCSERRDHDFDPISGQRHMAVHVAEDGVTDWFGDDTVPALDGEGDETEQRLREIERKNLSEVGGSEVRWLIAKLRAALSSLGRDAK